MDAAVRTTGASPRKLRAACDQCHASKVKCPGGGPPCKKCADSSQPCHYSIAARTGKPPGSKNKKTLDRLKRLSQNAEASNAEQNSAINPTETAAERNWSSEEHETEGRNNQETSPNELTTLASLLQSPLGISRPSFSDEVGSAPPTTTAFTSVANHDNVMQLDDTSFLPSVDLSLPGHMLDADEPSQFDSAWLEDASWEPPIMETPTLSGSNEALSSSSILLRGSQSQRSRPVSLSAVVAVLDEPFGNTDGMMPTQNRQQSLCRCMRELTDTLCQLHAIEKRQSPVQVDTLLTCSTFVLKTTENYLKCLQCRDDMRTQMQVIMVFQTIFGWAQMHVHPEGPCPDLSVTLGRHEMSRDEAIFVRFAVVSRALDRCGNAVRMIAARVDKLVANKQGRQTWSSGRSELQNLQQSSRSLCQTSIMLIRQFAARKERGGIK